MEIHQYLRSYAVTGCCEEKFLRSPACEECNNGFANGRMLDGHMNGCCEEKLLRSLVHVQCALMDLQMGGCWTVV